MILVEEWINQSKEDRQSHLQLDEPCCERGGTSTNHKGVLAEYLHSTIPHGCKIHLCHACNNEKCSNPKHLYWGTPSENSHDAVDAGTHPGFKQKGMKKGPRPKSECNQISKTLSGRKSNNPTGVNGYTKGTISNISWDVDWLIEKKKLNLTNVEIGKMLGVTESTIRKRLKWMEKNNSPVV